MNYFNQILSDPERAKWLSSLKIGDTVIVQHRNTDYRNIGNVIDNDIERAKRDAEEYKIEVLELFESRKVYVKAGGYLPEYTPAAKDNLYHNWFNLEDGLEWDGDFLIQPTDEALTDLDRHNLQAELSFRLRPSEKRLEKGEIEHITSLLNLVLP